jgi:hypothetical protein
MCWRQLAYFITVLACRHLGMKNAVTVSNWKGGMQESRKMLLPIDQDTGS